MDPETPDVGETGLGRELLCGAVYFDYVHLNLAKFPDFMEWTKCPQSCIKGTKVKSNRIKQRKEIRMYLQRVAIGVVAAALVASSDVASAQSDATKKPLGKMSCED